MKWGKKFRLNYSFLVSPHTQNSGSATYSENSNTERDLFYSVKKRNNFKLVYFSLVLPHTHRILAALRAPRKKKGPFCKMISRRILNLLTPLLYQYLRQRYALQTKKRGNFLY